MRAGTADDSDDTSRVDAKPRLDSTRPDPPARRVQLAVRGHGAGLAGPPGVQIDGDAHAIAIGEGAVEGDRDVMRADDGGAAAVGVEEVGGARVDVEGAGG